MRVRSLAVLALSLAGPSSALAADLDYDFLRGSDYDPPAAVAAIDWSGVYLGGHAGYSSAAVGYKNAYQQTLADYFRARDIETEFGVSTLLTAPSQRVGGTTFGAFAGYNVQLDDIVVGIEGDYTRFDNRSFSRDSIASSVTTSSGINERVFLTGLSRTDIQDYGTLRARAGYALGSFLPFVTGGLAIGRATVYDQIGVPSEISRPSRPKVKTVGGLALGGGLEYAITPSILLRAEYQYVLFNDFDGHKANINTVRGGAAVKF